jgi:hypothetical protein
MLALIIVAVVLRINEIDKREILYGGRQFEVYCESEFSGRMCCVSIYEVVHPNRKIFKCKYRDTVSFWVDDYETIKEGIYKCIARYIREEEKENQIVKKWEELDNDSNN